MQGLRSISSLKTWGKFMSLGVERQKQGRQDCHMELLAFQNGQLFQKTSGTSYVRPNIQAFSSFYDHLAYMKRVQSVWSRVRMSTMETKQLSKRQPSFIRGVVPISQLKCLRSFAKHQTHVLHL